jgi:PleD family two-component response regulator
MARILIAEAMAEMPKISSALSAHELLETTTLQQAVRLVIEDGIELFVIGVHFDDSRAVELVKLIRADKNHQDTPVLMVRLAPSKMADFIRQTLETMKAMQVISDYLELENDAFADSKLRDAVSACLPGGKQDCSAAVANKATKPGSSSRTSIG